MLKKRTTYTEGWKLYPLCMLGHHVEGTLASFLILSGTLSWMLWGCMFTLLYIAYQGLSVLRKQDSPGLDISDFMVGFGIGIVLYYIAGIIT